MPRRSPDRLAWAQCERWPEPGAFWNEPVGADELADLELKYSTLLGLIDAPAGRDRDAGLRAVAARWPGVLREGQLVPRDVLQGRRDSLGVAPGSPRGSWGIAAVPLWSVLHALLADVARIRGAGLGPADLPGALEAGPAGRWPSESAWWAALAWPLDARVTRSWLAAVVDVEPSELDRLLRA